MENKGRLKLRRTTNMANVISAPKTTTTRDGEVLAGGTFGLTGWVLQAAGVGDLKAGNAGVWADEGIKGFVKRTLVAHLSPDPRMVEEDKTQGYFWFAFLTLVALFSFSLVFLAICLLERVHLLTL